MPTIVFINNKKLLKESFIKTMEDDNLHMMELKAKAEVNEFLYYKLKDSGLSARLDE